MLLKADLKPADLANVIAGAVAQHNGAPGAIDVAAALARVCWRKRYRASYAALAVCHFLFLVSRST
jgi:hypothetical protein